MKAIQTTTNTYRIELENDEIFETIIGEYSSKKYFISSFIGSGTLEMSDDGENWRDTTIGENTEMDLKDSLQRYGRISGNGSKTVYLVHLYK